MWRHDKGNGFKVKKHILRLDTKNLLKILYCEIGEALTQLDQGGCGCSIPRSLVKGIRSHCRGLETKWSLMSLAAQAIL